MARSHETQATEAREKATELETEIEALEDLRDEVLDADRIGDTRLSKLFHEARTTRKGHWKTVSAFIRIEDGEAVVDHLDKLSDGHWSPETRQRYDAIIGVGVRPFMESAMFKSMVRDAIQHNIDGARQNLQHYREDAKTHEHMAEREA